MYITNVTNDYHKITCSNYTEYDTITFSNDNSSLCNCTNKNNNDNNIELILLLFAIIPCAMSLICLISLMVNTLLKHFFKKNNIFI